MPKQRSSSFRSTTSIKIAEGLPLYDSEDLFWGVSWREEGQLAENKLPSTGRETGRVSML